MTPSAYELRNEERVTKWDRTWPDAPRRAAGGTDLGRLKGCLPLIPSRYLHLAVPSLAEATWGRLTYTPRAEASCSLLLVKITTEWKKSSCKTQPNRWVSHAICQSATTVCVCDSCFVKIPHRCGKTTEIKQTAASHKFNGIITAE